MPGGGHVLTHVMGVRPSHNMGGKSRLLGVNEIAYSVHMADR